MQQKNSFKPISKLASKIVSEINQMGIRKWDLYLYDEQVNGIHFRKINHELEYESHDLRYFIRVFHPIDEETMGIGAVELNATNFEEIQKAIRRAQITAKTRKDPKYDLVSPSNKLVYSNPKVIDQVVWDNPQQFVYNRIEELTKELKEIMRAQTSFAKFRAYKTQKMLVNSNGFNRIKDSTHFYYEFAFRAKDKQSNKLAEYWTSGNVKTVDQLKFHELIPEWSTMAQDSLHVRSPKFQSKIDVLFTPKLVRIALLETLGYAVTGPALYSRTTPLKIGQKIASDKFTMIDNGIWEGGLHTSSWDSEGFPKMKTTIIENGIMKNFLFDQKCATLLGTKSSGNAQRYPNKAGIPEVEINNLIVKPGSQSLKEIVSNTEKMLYVNKFSWLRPNPITGDFGATILNGYMIENGKIGYPIKGGTLSGNIYQMLNNIEAISSENRIVENSCVPFIKFNNLRLTAQ